MSTERVDKQWKTKGLSGYSTSAILGTLGHYGVSLDEAGFKTLASSQYPLQIAGGWKLAWKGTGPFAPFPYAAADELMRRLLPDRVTPASLAEKIVALLARSSELVRDGKSAEIESTFDAVEKLLAGLPPAGETRSLFTSELVGFLDRFTDAFEQLPRALQIKGQPAFAARAAALQESIFLDRKGVVTALLKAEAGERDVAVTELTALVTPADGRSIFTRYWALDGLTQLGAMEAIRQHGLALFDDAAATNQWPLADSIIHLVARQTETSPTLQADQGFMQAVMTRFEEAHRRVGHHGH